MPDSGSSTEPSLSWLTFTPWVPGRQCLPGAVAIVTPTVWQRQHAAADVLGDLDGHHQFTAGSLDHGGVGQSELGGVVGVDL